MYRDAVTDGSKLCAYLSNFLQMSLKLLKKLSLNLVKIWVYIENGFLDKQLKTSSQQYKAPSLKYFFTVVSILLPKFNIRIT
jgi:hypothetical protein